MNLPELITKLLLIERQLIEDGVEVNTVEVLDNFDRVLNEVNAITENSITWISLVNNGF